MIKIQNLEVFYSDKKVLDGINLTLNAGEFCFILGPNGAGKSTLLKSINGILKIRSGNVEINGTNINQLAEKELSRQIAFIPQSLNMQFDYRVFEFTLMGRFPWINHFGGYSENDKRIVEKYLDLLKLESFKDCYFNELSGGERQRVLIARALVQESEYILMDESICFLDINHQIEILHLLKNVIKTLNKTIIMVSHNLNLAAEFADNLVLIKQGQLVVTGTVSEIFTREILSSVFNMEIYMTTNPYTGINNIVVGSEIG